MRYNYYLSARSNHLVKWSILACSITFVNILLNFIKVQMYDKSLYLEQKVDRTFVRQRDKSQTGFLAFAFK